MDLAKLNKFHKTKLGFLIFGVAELAIAYGFASLSIDRGNLWWYILGFIFLFGGLQNLVKFVGWLFGWKGKHG